MGLPKVRGGLEIAMNYLTYSPFCEAYIETRSKDGGRLYYDISQDITNMSISRQIDDASTFKIDLANKDRKYNGLFQAMDRITMYATKTERYRLLTGYITDVSVFTLYPGEFHIWGKCSLYQVQRMFWDPGLFAVQAEFGGQYSQNIGEWMGADMLVRNLLTNVGGWSGDSIQIGSMPNSVIDWASGLYSAQADELEQSDAMMKAFSSMLHSSSVPIGLWSMDFSAPSGSAAGADGASSGDSVAQGDVCALYMSWAGRFSYSQADGRLEPLETGYGDCSSTIWAAYKQALNIDVGSWTGAMLGHGREVKSGSGSLPIDIMEPGDLVLVNWYGYNPTYDHVELYVGNNKLYGHGGPGRGPTEKSDAAAYGTMASDWQIRRVL